MMKMIMIIILNSFIIMIFINSFPSHYKEFHPIIMGSILMMVNIFMSMSISIFNNNSWWSFISFLIIIGGLMILFLYFISFINDMITSFKLILINNFFIKYLIFLIFLFMMILKMNYFLIWYNYINLNFIVMNSNNNIINLYMFNKNFILLFSIIYLLIMLILIVKMIIINKFTLRKISN